MAIQAHGPANVIGRQASRSNTSENSRSGMFLLILAGWYGREMSKESYERLQEYNMGMS